jgi:3-methyladenine DNA glycosylase AlkD
MLTFDLILERLKSLSNPKAIEGMAKFAISSDRNFGVSMPKLRKLGKEIGRGHHQLAQQLWEAKYRETMILAGLVDDPKELTADQMENWVLDFYDWEICDQTIMNLFEKNPLAWKKTMVWSGRKEEFVKRAGFVLMARLAVSDKKAPDEKFVPFFGPIKREAFDNRIYVKKGINWALRQIGKRNMELNEKCIIVAREIQQLESAAAKWIARDAIKEMTNEMITHRIKERPKGR